MITATTATIGNARLRIGITNNKPDEPNKLIGAFSTGELVVLAVLVATTSLMALAVS